MPFITCAPCAIDRITKTNLTVLSLVFHIYINPPNCFLLPLGLFFLKFFFYIQNDNCTALRTFLYLVVRRVKHVFSTPLKEWKNGDIASFNCVWKIRVNRLQSHLPYPSNARSSTPFIRQKVCYSLMFWYPPKKFWRFACIQNPCDEVQFTVLTLHAMGPKNTPVSKLLPLCDNPTHLRIYKYICLHWAMPHFNTIF